MRVFVTGGTGYLGSVVLTQLVQQEFEVLALVRDPKRLVVRGVQGVQGSLEDLPRWEEHLRGCDACIHLVGILREDAERMLTYERIHYQATVDLLRSCGKLGVQHFVHLSANGAERALRIPYMVTKAKAEQAVRAGPLAWTLIRPSLIYGGRPDCYNFFGVLREHLNRAPAFPYFGDGAYRLAPISADEVAEAIIAALRQPEARGQAYHLCGAQVYTYKALLRTMIDVGKFRCRLFPLPFWAIESVAGLLGSFSWFPLTPDMIRMLREGNTCPAGARTGQDLGVVPRSLKEWLEINLTQRPALPQPAPFVAARAPAPPESPGGTSSAHPTQSLSGQAHLTRDLALDDLESPPAAHPTTTLSPEALGGHATSTLTADSEEQQTADQTRPLQTQAAQTPAEPPQKQEPPAQTPAEPPQEQEPPAQTPAEPPQEQEPPAQTPSEPPQEQERPPQTPAEPPQEQEPPTQTPAEQLQEEEPPAQTPVEQLQEQEASAEPPLDGQEAKPSEGSRAQKTARGKRKKAD